MLEDVVDKEAGPKPKLVTPPAPPAAVGSAVRHIAQDELDAYISGRLFGARLDNCRNHLDVCEECRVALEDLRTFKASAVGLSQASSLKRELDRRQRQRQLKSAATGLAAAAVAAAIGMVGWNKFGKAWVHSATAAIARARDVAPAATDATASTPAQAAEVAPPNETASAASTAPHATPVAQPRATVVASAQTGAPQSSPSRGSKPGPMSAASPAGQSYGTIPAASVATSSPVQSHGTTPTASVASSSPAQSHGTTPTANVGTSGPAQSHGTTPTANVGASGPAQSHGEQAAVAARAQSALQPRSATAAQTPMQSQTVVQSRGAGSPGVAQPAAAEAGSTSFALLGPFGDEVTDDRPEFSWQPLAGAAKYSIIIVDEGLRPIAHTRLKTTTWRPKKPLRRGRGYLWQVTAILKNGTKVMATGPTSQEARIHITARGK